MRESVVEASLSWSTMLIIREMALTNIPKIEFSKPAIRKERPASGDGSCNQFDITKNVPFVASSDLIHPEQSNDPKLQELRDLEHPC